MKTFRMRCGVGLAVAVATTLVAMDAARAQYTDSMGYSYNNMMSATIGTYLQGQSNMFFTRQALMRSMYDYEASRQRVDPQTARGQKIVRQGRATMRFSMRPFPLAKWMNSWAQNNRAQNKAVDRERDLREWYSQRALWQNEMKARGARYGDMADAMAVAFMISYEAATGKRASNAGYRYVRKSFYNAWIKDVMYQGRTATMKQDLYENKMVGSTYALYLRRQGLRTRNAALVEQGRQKGIAFVNELWKPNANALFVTLNRLGGKSAPKILAAGTVKSVAPKTVASSTRATRASATQSQMLSFAQARQITSFRRVADDVLPAKFASQIEDKKARATIERVSRQLVQGTRNDFARNTRSNLPVDNVARSLTYYVTSLYAVSLAREGSAPGENLPQVSDAQMDTLRQQFAQVLANDKGFRRLSDREKQEMAELYLLVPSLAGVLYLAGLEEGDVEVQQQARQIARNGLQKVVGVAPEKLRFTAAGMQIQQ